MLVRFELKQEGFCTTKSVSSHQRKQARLTVVCSLFSPNPNKKGAVQ